MSALRIVVLGYMVRGPLGGMAWHHLQYVLGFAQLGHDVWFMEDSEDYPACYHPERFELTSNPEYGLRFTAHALERLGLGHRWAYHDAHTGVWLGPAGTRALEIAETADVLVNVSGVNPIRPWHGGIPVRVLVDTDPAFTQVRNLTETDAHARAASHTHFFTFAGNIGDAFCSIPDDGFPWRPTRQPVALGSWPVTAGPSPGRFTTVMQWDSYEPKTYDGSTYGLKSTSFQQFFDLPARVSVELELALGSPSAPRSLLRRSGWLISDPAIPSKDPWAYQAYLAGSKGEFSVAKEGYVTTNCGWFSERSANYLASGRPVVCQGTGFARWLPIGEGVLSVQDAKEAAVSINEVCRDYERHSRAARAIAEEHFDGLQVLSSLLDQSAGIPAYG